MNKYASTVLVLAAVQGILVGGYSLLRDRDGGEPALPTDPPETVQAPLPDLALRYGDGVSRSLADTRGRPLLLHFWATWCPPCRQELPGLLDLAAERGGRVLLVALDDDWESVRRFLDRPIPGYVALANGVEVGRLFGVRELPETFVVDPSGTMTMRFRGARDWKSASMMTLLPAEMK